MVSGQVSEAEYISAHQVHRRRIATAMNTVMIVIFCVGLVVFAVGSKLWGMMLTVGGIGGLIGEFVQARVAIPARLRRLYSQTKGRTDVTYSWDADKLFASSDHGQATRSWGDFPKARENNEVFLLYYNDAIFEIVSKRWFRDLGQINDFRSHLNVVK